METSIKFTADLNAEQMIKQFNVMLSEFKKKLGSFGGADIQLLDEAAIKSQFSRISAEFAKSGQEATKSGKFISNLSNEIKNAANSGSLLGKAFTFSQVTQAVSQVTQSLQFVAKAGLEYEKSLAAVGAITGLSGEQLDVLGQSARRLAVQFGTGVNTQMESFQGILSKLGPAIGSNPEALGLMAKNVNILAAAGGISAGEAMNAITDSMLQLGLVTGDAMKDAETSTMIINSIASSAQVGAAEIGQVQQSIIQAGVAAKGANLDINQLNAEIQVLALGGKTGSEAGVALRNVMGLLQNASGPAAAELKKMGLSSKELGETLTKEGLNEAMLKIKDGLKGFGSDAEKNAALIKIFGVENATAAGILIDNGDKYQEFLDGIKAGQDGIGSAFTQANTNMDTAGQRIDVWKAKVNDAFIGLSQSLGQGLTASIGFAGQMQPLISSLSGLGAILPTDALKSFGKQILTLIPGFVAAGGAGAASGTATSAAWLPVVAPIAAVAAGLAGLYLFFTKTERGQEIVKELGKAFQKLWDNAQPAIKGFENFGSALLDAFVSIGEAVYEWIVAPFEIGIEIITAVVSAISNLISGGNDSVGVFELIGKAYNYAAKSVQAVGKAFDFLTQMIKTSKATIIALIQNAPELFGVLFEYAKYYLNPANWLSGDAELEKKLSSQLNGVIKKIQDTANKSLSVKKAMDEGTESTKKLGDAQNKTNKAIESGVKSSDDANKKKETGLEIAKKLYDQEKKNLDNQLKQYENTSENLRLQENRKKTLADDIALQNEKNKSLEIEKSKLLELFKVTQNSDGQIIDVGVSVGKGTKKADVIQSLNNQLTDINNEIQKGQNATIELRAKIKTTAEELDKQLADLQEKQFEFEVSIGLKTDDDILLRTEKKLLSTKSKIQDINNQIASLQDSLKAGPGSNVIVDADQVTSDIQDLTKQLYTFQSEEIDLTQKTSEIKQKIHESDFTAAQELNAKYLSDYEARLNSEKDLQNLSFKVLGDASSLAANTSKENQLKALESKKQAELITEASYNSQKEQIEADYQTQVKLIQESIRAAELEAERQHTLNLLTEKQKRLESEQALLDPVKDKSKYDELGKQIEDIATQVKDKGDLLKEYSLQLQTGLTETFSNLFGGNLEGAKEGAKKIFAFMAGILKQQASLLVTQKIIEQLGISGVGLFSFLAVPVITGLVNAAVSKIIDPILSAVTSFATGGRVDEPTLAVVGDARNARRGSNTEWILRDDQLSIIMNMVLAKHLGSMNKVIAGLFPEYEINPSENDLSNKAVNKFGQIVDSHLTGLTKIHNSLNRISSIMESLPENLKGEMTIEKMIKISVDYSEMENLNQQFKMKLIPEDDYFEKYAVKQKQIKSYAGGSGFLYNPEIAMVGDAGVNNPEIVLNSPQLKDLIENVSQASNSALLKEMSEVKSLLAQLVQKDPNIYMDSSKVTDEIQREMNRRQKYNS